MKLHAVLTAALLVASGVSTGRLLAQARPPASIVGAWTLNKEKSDLPSEEAGRSGDENGREGGRHGGSGGRGGHGGGGFGGGGGRGGGFGGGPGGQGSGRGNEQEMLRRREALRTILEAPDRMTITSTDSMVIITSGDGRTTRLATDGSKVKDQSTGFEQRTHWEGDHLVTEFTGAGRSKIIQTYAADPQAHELVVTVQMEGGSNNEREKEGKAPAGTQKRVYDVTPEQ